MKLTDEMIVAIIGACAAIIGAIFSTISIILSNKNTKKIKWLENSKDVKHDIAEKRYQVYKNIITYINSYYDIKPYFQHNYKKCKANLLNINTNRLKDKSMIETELEQIQELSIQYFYLDKTTYWCLKSAESYLGQVISYMNKEKIENFNLFSYFIYQDLWTYILIIAKHVNKFISSQDLLKFKPSKKFNYKFSIKLFKKSNFYKLFYISLIDEKIILKINNRKKKETRHLKILENKIKTKLSQTDDKKSQNLRKKSLRKVDKLKIQISKIKPSKKLIKSSELGIYKIWKNCNSCENKDCPIHKSTQS